MTGFTLPRDNNSTTVQALSLSDNVSGNVDSSAHVRFTLPSLTSIVRIATVSNCFIKFGDSSVIATSSDVLFPLGAEIFSINGKGYTHVSILGTDAVASPASITKMV